jgi:hypothetical protein
MSDSPVTTPIGELRWWADGLAVIKLTEPTAWAAAQAPQVEVLDA